jgi:hypothetical protein
MGCHVIKSFHHSYQLAFIQGEEQGKRTPIWRVDVLLKNGLCFPKKQGQGKNKCDQPFY